MMQDTNDFDVFKAPVSLFKGVEITTPHDTAPLATILQGIQCGQWSDQISELRPLADRAEIAYQEREGKGGKTPAEKAYSQRKEGLLLFTASGTFSVRNNDYLISHSGVIIVDVDHLSPAEIAELRELLQSDPFTAFIFLSPSGHGLKIGIRIPQPPNGDPKAYQRAVWEAIAARYAECYNVTIDPAVKALAQSCFVSHDPDLFLNPDAQVFTIESPADAPSQAEGGPRRERTEYPETTIDDVRDVLRRFPDRLGYWPWLRVFSAICSGFGKQVAMDLCSERWPADEPGEYEGKAQSPLTRVLLATLFYEAKQYGIDTRRRDLAGLKVTEKGIEVAAADPINAATLADLAGEVNKELNNRTNRETKRKVAVMVTRWLLSRDRLLKDVTDPQNMAAYMITDAGAAVAIAPGMRDMRLALADAGINASEPVYTWLTHDLEHTAIKSGRDVMLSRWSTVHKGKLYISAGKSRMVVAEPGQPLREVANGTDGVLFAAESTFPTWQPVAPIDPATIQGLRVNLTAPDEVPDYDHDAQIILLISWLICAIMGIRPLPLLLNIGSKGSGKSTVAKALLKLLLGSGGDLSPAPNKYDSFVAAATNLPLYGLDNVDSMPEKWFQDAVATAVTGGKLQDRKYYTNSELHERTLSAGLIITSRTATFANRADVTERILPLFFGPMSDNDRCDEVAIYSEVVANRAGMLSWLALEAAAVLQDGTEARGLPGRFQMFAKIATRDPDEVGRGAMSSWIKAQNLSIGENDPLFDAIREYLNDENKPLPLESQRPAALVKLLNSGENTLPFQGGGKAIARKLRELQPSLLLAGIVLTEDTHGGQKVFTLRKSS